jgi:hypothetical protein
LELHLSAGVQEVIQEQITRVLLERLIVNRPHPWGLLITFIELIKNPRSLTGDPALTPLTVAKKELVAVQAHLLFAATLIQTVHLNPREFS